MLSKSSPRMAGGGAAPLLPAHRTFRAAASRRASPTCIASARASTQAARRGELFPPCRRHLPPPLYRTCVRRSKTMISASLAYIEKSTAGESATMRMKERDARIKKELQEPELSPSPYDTAWVAMVPLQGLSRAPRFPQCVQWILQNQQDNGSWGISEVDSSTNKCSLLSTLACIVALKKWNVGSEQIRRGLHFIGKTFSIVLNKQIATPIGFNITFTGMVSLAIGMGLELPVKQTSLDAILHIRQMELKRFVGDKSYGRGAYMAYIAEGLGSMVNWNEVMKFQWKNGSLFNSPSTTAAALIYHYDEKALQYLNLLVSKFGSAVPTLFPISIYCQLSMVDSLENTGISRYFSSEIKSIMDMIYRSWLQRDEEIMLDVATCAMAFRILRMNGYDVSSDDLTHVAGASDFHNSLQGYIDDTKSLLELYKASRVSVSKNEPVLDNIGYWSGNLLTKKLCSGGVNSMSIFEEVKHALKVPFYATMERLDHRRNIEHSHIMGYQMLKTSYFPCQVNKDHLAFAIEDFTLSQFHYQDELLHLESWVKESKLDKLKFARMRLTYAYLSASAAIFPLENSDARILLTKHAVLATISDDFFDVAGSKEELENLLELSEKWDEHHKVKFYSERVKILFCAIYTTVNQFGEKASVLQNRDVRKHMIELWLGTMRSMMTEAEWVRSQYVPTIDEYMTIANISYALGPLVLAPLYFLGQELSDAVVKDQDYNELFRLMNTSCRLLNDIQGFEREGSQGKVNSISLVILESGGSMSIEEAKKMTWESIASCRRDLLRFVLKEDSVVPRPCRELFWKMYKINHLFYSQSDGYSSPEEMVSAVNAVIYEPLKLQISHPCFDIKSEQ